MREFMIAGLVILSATAARAQTGVQKEPPPPTPMIGFAVFGDFGYERLSANRSFGAVLGTPGGGIAGGGGEIRLKNVFLNASVDHFSKTGQRVAVVDGAVYHLGVPDTITMIPLHVSLGWRFVHERATPYVGAGAGRIWYREQTPYTDGVENVDTRFASYHVVGGVEFRNEWVATAFEVQYTRAPGALGVSGASAAFNESDLGGVSGRIKILVGR
jgi:opacity protein-like surface antigen